MIICFIYEFTDNGWSKFTHLDCVTRELIASGGPMVTGQSAMAAQNHRLELESPILDIVRRYFQMTLCIYLFLHAAD